MRKTTFHHDESAFPVADWLGHRLRAAGGILGWREVMDLALYDPEHGYYSRTDRGIGRDGDYYTSVSVGALFGWLMALQADQAWRRMGCPDRFTIVEQGAHDGRAALDLWSGLAAVAPELASRVSYAIVEPRESWRRLLSERLRPVLGSRLDVVPDWGALSMPGGGTWPGMAWSNELLDAFPVDRLVWSPVEGAKDARWWRMGVRCEGSEGGFRVRWDPMESIDGIGSPPDQSWEMERCPGVRDWVNEVSASGLCGLWLTIDYGVTEEELWFPERAAGSLRRFTGHRTDDQLLADLGDCDLTADVNFTQVMEAQQAAGWSSVRLEDQGAYLTRLAAPWLQAWERAVADGSAFPEPPGAWRRQLASLTHPGWLGRRFKVLAAERPE